MARTVLLSLPLFLAACSDTSVKAFNAEPEGSGLDTPEHPKPDGGMAKLGESRGSKRKKSHFLRPNSARSYWRESASVQRSPWVRRRLCVLRSSHRDPPELRVL